jgi:hypothetical protein
LLLAGPDLFNNRKRNAIRVLKNSPEQVQAIELGIAKLLSFALRFGNRLLGLDRQFIDSKTHISLSWTPCNFGSENDTACTKSK